MGVTRLMYYSQNHLDPSVGSVVRALNGILSASNRNNRVLGLTGALLFDDQWFLQVLEGDREKVWRTFDRIREDDRHSDVVVAEVVEVEERVFGNWWMGLARREPATEHVFASFSKDARLVPPTMSARQILALMSAVASLGLSRVIARPRGRSDVVRPLRIGPP